MENKLHFVSGTLSSLRLIAALARWSFAIIVMASCTPQRVVIPVDRNAHVLLGNVTLNQSEVNEVADQFANLTSANREITSRADCVLVINSPHGKKELFSFYLDDSFFHRGSDLDAMTERMEGGDTQGYVINEALKAILAAVESRNVEKQK